METKKLEEKAAKLKDSLKGSEVGDPKTRALRKLLKRTQRKIKAVKVKAAMVASKAAKKPEKEEAA